MCMAGLVFLAAGVVAFRKEIAAARGLDKLVALGPVLIAASLAAFAPEHFKGPEYIDKMAPSYMPWHGVWAYFVGCALLAAATSINVRKFERLSTSLLGLMFFLFVCMIYLPSAVRHADSRFAWAYVLRDLSFCAGAWALAGMHNRAAWPRLSSGMILFARMVLAIAAIDYGVQHFLHPTSAPGVPLEMMTPAWVPFPSVWGYVAGAVLLAAGIGLALNRKVRLAAASVGALMTALTVFLYLPVAVMAYGGSAGDFNDAINYLADTLLYAGSALAVGLALRASDDPA
jgi:uncharacterized membrane protein